MCDDDLRIPVARFTTMVFEHDSRRSSLTVMDATCRSRAVLTLIEEETTNPSEYYVGLFHVLKSCASSVPTSSPTSGASL